MYILRQTVYFVYLKIYHTSYLFIYLFSNFKVYCKKNFIIFGENKAMCFKKNCIFPVSGLNGHTSRLCPNKRGGAYDIPVLFGRNIIAQLKPDLCHPYVYVTHCMGKRGGCKLSIWEVMSAVTDTRRRPLTITKCYYRTKQKHTHACMNFAFLNGICGWFVSRMELVTSFLTNLIPTYRWELKSL